MKQNLFDVIIVGAGSAGCVLAERLSADGATSVLLLEAGGPAWNPLIAMPMGATIMTKLGLYDWGDISDPDEHLGDRRTPVLHGKVIGGSSSVNYMAHTRGHPNDYARWEAAGANGWSYRDVLPYFKQVESWYPGENEWRGGHGPIGAYEPPMTDPIHEAWHKAILAKGLPITDDYNGALPEGVGRIQYSVKNGRRSSAARGFLDPARKRPNLTVQSNALATRLIFEGRRVAGVEYSVKGQMRHARCTDRVVLSCGAINTPQLLMLSGIGPADHLQSLEIKPRMDLPVGKNLEDHIGFHIAWARKGSGDLHRSMRLDRMALRIARAHLFGGGPAASLPPVYIGYVKTEPALPQPDIELLLALPAADADYWFPGIRSAFKDSFGAKVYLTAQESLGEVLLRSADPRDRPIIRHRSLSAPGDLAKLRQGYKIARDVAEAVELDAFRGPMIVPEEPPRDDAAIDAFIHRTAFQQFHPASTCRMGCGPDAVLEPDFKVRGIDGLYVVDGSAMPRLISGHPNVVIMMMAARAADLWRCGVQPS